MSLRSFKAFSQLGLLQRRISYFYNLFIGKFGSWMLFSFVVSVSYRKATSTFFYHIVHIVLVVSQKKMSWIYALSNVTFMKNPKTFRYFTKMQTPGYSMCGNSLSVKPNYTIQRTTISGSLPKPTCSGFFNFFKEPFFYWSRFNSHNPYLVYRTEVV